MSRKAAVCLVLLLGSVFVAVGASRTVSDLQLSTLTGMPLTFEVAVTDDEIDPLAPETHALFFSIERGPQHGVVAGDFAAVLYSAPSTAMLILTYTPAPGFVGADSLVVSAEDPLGERVDVEITIDVRERESAGVMTGTSQISATINVQPALMTSLDWTGEVKYSILAASAGFGFRLHREAADYAFDDLYFTASAPFAGIATASSRVDFNPDPTSDFFDSAEATLAVRPGDASLAATFSTDGTQTGSRIFLGLSGRSDRISLSSTATLRLCSPWFGAAP